MHSLIDPPTSWQPLLSSLEGRAEQEGWLGQVEEAYGAVMKEAAQWEARRGKSMSREEIEFHAKQGGLALRKACDGNEKLMAHVRGYLEHGGHALSLLGWLLVDNANPNLGAQLLGRSMRQGGERMAALLLAWEAMPSEINTKLPVVGERPRQQFIRFPQENRHPLAVALGFGGLESAKHIWRSILVKDQDVLDGALLAIMAFTHESNGPTKDIIAWAATLLEAGANPNRAFPVTLSKSGGAIGGPGNGVKFPPSIRQEMEADPTWRSATDYSYGPFKTFAQDEGAAISANDLVMTHILSADRQIREKWQDLWKNQWRRQPPILALPWQGTPLDALIKRTTEKPGTLANSARNLGAEESREYALQTLLPLLASQGAWWDDKPTTSVPWRAWDVVAHTLYFKPPGTGLPPPELGTGLLETLLNTLPDHVPLPVEKIQQAAMAIIENVSLVHIRHSDGSSSSFQVSTQADLLNQAMSLMISRAEMAHRPELLRQKANLIEEMNLAAQELVDEMSERQKSGLDYEDLRESAGLRTRRLLLQAQSMIGSAPRVGFVPRM